MTTPEPVTIREPTAWLRTTAKHRARGLVRTARKAAERHPGATIIAALTPGQDLTHGSRDDRTCDRCRSYVPTDHKFGLSFYTITVNDTPVMFVIGLCDTHMRAEIPDLDTLDLPTPDTLNTTIHGEARR